MQYFDYIIVGAGPAGLQMGYFLEQAGYSYVILESADHVASFFAKQPRRRTLISLNKCYNWFDEPDFNLRYDWNSLLTHDNSLLFTDYTKELYPHADVLVEYLQDFAEKFALKIQFNTRVSKIDRQTDGDRNFVLTDQQENEYQCRCLLMATGAVKPNMPDIEGIELAEGYEDYDTDPEKFINKRVMIMGIGNSAFEVANEIAPYAAMVHVVTNDRMVQHSWQSHFVGDLRAINNNFLEMSQLKMPFPVEAARVTKITKHGQEALKVHTENDVAHWSVPGTLSSAHVFDRVIRCTGWKYVDQDLFAPEIKPTADKKSKYTTLDSIWETNVPDLFYIGTAMANNDRKTTPGFIHGFRYNIRTIFHLLEERYHDVPLPAETFPLETIEELEALSAEVVTRLSTTSALFQMFGVLADLLIFDEGSVRWLSEVPLEHALARPEFTEGKGVLAITLELGFGRFFEKETDSLSFVHPNDPAGEGQCTSFIHPVLRHYRDGELIKETHLKSAVFVRYDSPNDKFVERFNSEKPRNLILNQINEIAGLKEEPFTIKAFNKGTENFFTPWPADRPVDASHLPSCIRINEPDFVPDASRYG